LTTNFITQISYPPEWEEMNPDKMEETVLIEVKKESPEWLTKPVQGEVIRPEWEETKMEETVFDRSEERES